MLSSDWVGVHWDPRYPPPPNLTLNFLGLWIRSLQSSWYLKICGAFAVCRCTMLKHPVHSLAPLTLYGHASRKFMEFKQKSYKTRLHSSRMRAARSSSRLLGGVWLSACSDTPPPHGPGHSPGCGPGHPLWPDPPTSPLGLGLDSPHEQNDRQV